MKRKLIIFGNNGFAEMVAHYFEAEAQREVVAFTVHERFIATSRFGSRPLVSFESLSSEFDPAAHDLFVALEHGRQNVGRAEVIEAARTMGFRLASFISRAARISAHAKIGEHCLVLENAIIQYGVEIGPNNLVSANSFFGQSCTVGANNYFGNGFFADRHVRIGSFGVFGSQVRIGEGLAVHDWANLQPFETVRESIRVPTIIHPILRAPGQVIDRRRSAL